MRKTWMLLVVVVSFCVLALTAIRAGAQSPQPISPTYTWSGELVSLDAAGRNLTVKSRVVGEQALAELPRFKSGDRIVLTWSGYDSAADGILRVVRYDAAKKWSEPFTFPVEFAAYEEPRQYVTFKFQVPAASVAATQSVKPGEWITSTARHRPASEAEAITAVRAYTDTSAAATTTN
jgi:hypothetical protein